VKILIQEALGYTALSAIALCVDVAILWILVRYFSWPYLVAATVSYSVGLLLGYVFSVRLVFSYRRLKGQPLEFSCFAAIGLVGLAINASTMFFGVRFLTASYLLVKCGAAGLTFAWNFAARRQLLFVQRRAG
jgi:putative flippase GtrA